MNDDFVSFDLAKKLKEKGFREEVNAYYGKWENLFDVHPALDMNDCDYRASAPTISQVLKWLRENKELFVEVSVNNHTGFDFYFTIYEKGEECWIVCGFNEEWYDTYEAAAISGIEYVIDNLI